MRQFPTTPIENEVIAPARTVMSWQHARKTVLADLSQKKSMCSDVEHDAGTRYGLAGLWLCTDASEPQYTSVIIMFKNFWSLIVCLVENAYFTKTKEHSKLDFSNLQQSFLF